MVEAYLRNARLKKSFFIRYGAGSPRGLPAAIRLSAEMLISELQARRKIKTYSLLLNSHISQSHSSKHLPFGFVSCLIGRLIYLSLIDTITRILSDIPGGNSSMNMPGHNSLGANNLFADPESRRPGCLLSLLDD